MITQIELDFLRESNAIEGVYDEMYLQGAIFTWEYLKKAKKLSPQIIKDAHSMLIAHFSHLSPDEVGEFRQVGVTIGGRLGFTYDLIPTMMTEYSNRANRDLKILKEDMREEHIKANHVFFEHVHPFVDGNGRIGRMLMNWERIRAGLDILVIREDEKEKYYDWF